MIDEARLAELQKLQKLADEATPGLDECRGVYEGLLRAAVEAVLGKKGGK